jgi:hypothetical protein
MSRVRTNVSYRNAPKHGVNIRPTGDDTQKTDWVSTPDKMERSGQLVESAYNKTRPNKAHRSEGAISCHVVIYGKRPELI